MSFGYAGKILHVDLSSGTTRVIPTARYESWGGGHGMGSAIFWDLCRDKNIGGFDPRNIVTIMSTPLAGTLAPGASRCEVQGIGPQGYPVEWFTWSNFGGRFAAQLKYAGWDGIVIEGKSDRPVWLNIVDDLVTLEEAADLWGKDTRETQSEIWRRVSGGQTGPDGAPEDRRNTPAVLCIGPSGERLSRIAALLHDAGNAAGQGGFGGVFGSKKLKAVSVLGTGGIGVADPRALMQSWLWYRANFVYNVDAPIMESPKPNSPGFFSVNSSPGGAVVLKPAEPSRPRACRNCPLACHQRTSGGIGDESKCMPTMWPYFTLLAAGSGDKASTEGLSKPERALALHRARYRTAEMLQRSGINAFEMCVIDAYLLGLFGAGMVGADKALACPLPFDRWQSEEFKQGLVRMVVDREGIGDDLAEGVVRAALKWGRYDQDLQSGLLPNPFWGWFEHYEPRVEVEWSYGSLLSSRDTNDHGFNYPFYTIPRVCSEAGMEPILTAQQTVELVAGKVPPFAGDEYMFDYGQGPTGIYSSHKAKTVAWSRRYGLFWKNSVGFCDFLWPSFININAPGRGGATPEGEPRFFNAVTGRNMSFEDGMQAGRRIWNLDRAILALQGRRRDREVFAGYVYDVPSTRPHIMPVYDGAGWSFSGNVGRVLSRQGVEDWKTSFFEMEGWDTGSGWPTRKTLEELGMDDVADTLEDRGR